MTAFDCPLIGIISSVRLHDMFYVQPLDRGTLSRSDGGIKVESKAVFDVKADSDTLLDHVDFLRIDASRRLDPAHRAEMGQFFTPQPVARLMASMFAKGAKKLTIIDPGAVIA